MPILAVEDKSVGLDLALGDLVRAEGVIAHPEHLVVDDGLLEQGQPRRAFPLHPVGYAYALAEALYLVPSLRCQDGFYFGSGCAGGFALGGCA